ncbi:MAG: radical SAM protein [Myxococcales bacterium]|nr:radical SAM protein [Myxococcales bacterium]
MGVLPMWARMRIALITVYSHRECTLKDVAGGFGTVFRIGSSPFARWLEAAKGRITRLPSPILGYLAALAKQAGHDVRTYDLRRGNAGQDPVPDADLAIVLSSMVDAPSEREVLADLRARGTPTICVGSFASARPSYFSSVADTVVLGEPENLGPSLFDRRPRGIVQAGFVDDLDELPFPRWDEFPFGQYRYALLSHGAPTLPVSGVRGCAFGCGYCPFRVTSKFRQRKPERVTDEVRYLKTRYGARGISFRDPLFNLDKERVLELADRLTPLNVRFSAEMRADRIDEESLVALQRAGLRSMEIGVESVNVDMLRAEKRSPPSITQVEEVVSLAKGLGIRVIANFVMGLPEDTEPQIRETVAWAKRLNPFAVQFTVATPYPGTTLEDRVTLTRRDPASYTGWEPVFIHPTLRPERLRELREWAYVSFHRRPRYIRSFAGHALRSFQ